MMATLGMRARPFGRPRTHGGVPGHLRGWLPLHAWSGRRRAAVAAVLGVLATCLVSGACVILDVGGEQAAQSTLADAHARLAGARQTLASLPALQREAHDGQDGPQRGREGSAAGDIRGISQLAAQAGLVLITLEPAASGGARGQTFRSTKLVALGSFGQLSTFLEGLATLPELVVPAELSVRRSRGGLAVSAVLQVFDGLPAAVLSRHGDEGGALADPFASGFSGVQGAAWTQGGAAMRLSGMLVERGRAVALVETAEGTVAVQTGATLAGAQVSSVNPVRIVLSLDGATHTLGWAEDAK